MSIQSLEPEIQVSILMKISPTNSGKKNEPCWLLDLSNCYVSYFQKCKRINLCCVKP